MLRRLLILLSLGLLFSLALLGGAECLTRALAADYCVDKLAQLPAHEHDRVGLVLGCSPTLSHGGPNYYFQGRIAAAAQLWQAGKLRCIIVSGDNRFEHYDEATAMKEALVAAGVPAEKIVCDFAGLCTYDSVARASQIFGARQLLIISQPSHVKRAVAIAHYLGVDALGFEAPLVSLNRKSTLRQWTRERLARLSMAYDLFTNRRPQHMGAHEELPL